MNHIKYPKLNKKETDKINNLDIIVQLEKELKDARKHITILMETINKIKSQPTIEPYIDYNNDIEDLDEWHQLFEMDMNGMYIDTGNDISLSNNQHCLQHHEFYGSC
jgi:hypothetical protein